VYRTLARQKPSLTVLYGSFNDHGAAKEALQTLPASLRAFKPILRTVQGIQGEIKRHESAERQQGNANS
jgi:septal ring-binding cell division protein DamX